MEALTRTASPAARCSCNQASAAALSSTTTLRSPAPAAIGRAAPAERGTALKVLARLTAPMTPHLAEDVWAMLGGEGLVAAAPWPEADERLLVEASVTLPVQVNGKRRAEIVVPAGSDAATVEALVLADAAVQRALNGASPLRLVVVPDRIVNVVV